MIEQYVHGRLASWRGVVEYDTVTNHYRWFENGLENPVSRGWTRLVNNSIEDLVKDESWKLSVPAHLMLPEGL